MTKVNVKRYNENVEILKERLEAIEKTRGTGCKGNLEHLRKIIRITIKEIKYWENEIKEQSLKNESIPFELETKTYLNGKIFYNC